MSKEVKKGNTIEVDINLEFTGTVRNYSILIESQYVPTTNDKAQKHPVKLDGDPIQIKANFIGVKGSVIKKFEVVINEKKWKIEDIIFKYEEIEVNIPVPYADFDLKQIAA